MRLDTPAEDVWITTQGNNVVRYDKTDAQGHVNIGDLLFTDSPFTLSLRDYPHAPSQIVSLTPEQHTATVKFIIDKNICPECEFVDEPCPWWIVAVVAGVGLLAIILKGKKHA